MEKMANKKIWIIVAGIVAGIIAIYMGASIYFMNHFYFGTQIGRVDVSGKSAAAAEKAVQKALDEYELVIKERDGVESTLLGADLSLSMEWKTKPESYINKQNGYAWIVKVLKPERYTLDGNIVYDEEKLNAKIAALPAMDAAKQVAAVDAKISEYNAEKGYTLVPSVPGTVVDVESFTSNIKTCIASLDESLDMAEGTSYVQPVVLDNNETLLATLKQMNLSLNSVITYQVGERTQVLDASTFQPWIYVKEDLTMGIQEEALDTYVKGLASTYNTWYSAKEFATSYGQTVKITNSHYGWRVDNAAEKAAIISDILSGTSVTRDLNYNMKGNSRDGNDYGNSYVEINLTAQHLFVYVNGQVVVESDFVSGNAKNNWNTPTGIWGLTYKTKNAVLRGDDYETPVNYWMPYAGNVGMHDATWRSEFGGTIYKTNGSHGCINLPKSKAKQIYEYVSKGFPVIVYNLAGTESVKDVPQDVVD